MTSRYQLGHTAFHHLGALPGDCVRGGSPYKPSPSSPYYQFGAQRRYPYAWSGAAGGVPQSRVASESRGLGIFDLRESGLSPDPRAYRPFPALKKSMLHQGYVPAADYPPVRFAGREPDDPRGDGRGALGLSDSEKKFGILAIAAIAGWFVYKRLGKAGPRGSRRLSRATRKHYAAARKEARNELLKGTAGLLIGNPRGRYEVHASASHKRRPGRRRRLEYGGTFRYKADAEEYARYLREGGHKARVKRR